MGDRLNGNGAKVRILVADDAPDVANRLAGMLSELEQVEVIGPACDGKEALELYDNYRPHGAVLDLQMPVLNGLEVLQTIRQRDASTFVIILTNQEGDGIRDRCREAGANHYLRKSTEFERAVDLIANFLRGKFLKKNSRRVSGF